MNRQVSIKILRKEVDHLIPSRYFAGEDCSTEAICKAIFGYVTKELFDLVDNAINEFLEANKVCL